MVTATQEAESGEKVESEKAESGGKVAVSQDCAIALQPG